LRAKQIINKCSIYADDIAVGTDPALRQAVGVVPAVSLRWSHLHLCQRLVLDVALAFVPTARWHVPKHIRSTGMCQR
jgi:hypothetical protein